MQIRVLFTGAAILAIAAGAGNAAVLNAVPMQGGMVMPMFSYRSDDARLHVVMDPEIPALTPLLVSHPGDQFHSEDPWFNALDPSREGRSFSRRYGFVMDVVTDPLPPGTQIWVRKISGSPDLSAYRYSGTAPKLFDPIFGTAGTTNALHWNGMMFHPVFTAVPGTNTLTAAFEAFLVDTATGVEVPESGTGPFILEWTNLPDGRPELALSQRFVVLWPAAATNYVLEGAVSLNGGWSDVTNSPVSVEGRSAVVLEPSDLRRFFRLKLVP